MPGHSLKTIRGRTFVTKAADVRVIVQNFEHLLDKFQSLAAGSSPRAWTASGWGGDSGPFVKIVVHHLAGILEALQRWDPNATGGIETNPKGPPNDQPGPSNNKNSDHDIIISLLTDLVKEIYSKPNADGSNSAGPVLPANPPKPYQQPAYDSWVMQMTILFHAELQKKRHIKQLQPPPVPADNTLNLAHTSLLLIQIIHMTPRIP